MYSEKQNSSTYKGNTECVELIRQATNAPCVRIVVASIENLINRQGAVKIINDTLYRREESFRT